MKSKGKKLEDYKGTDCSICTHTIPHQWLGMRQENGKTVFDVQAVVVVFCEKHSSMFDEFMLKAVAQIQSN